MVRSVLITGLGNIGSALARVVIQSGKFEVGVWNRSPEKCRNLFPSEDPNSTKYRVFENLLDGIQQSDTIVLSMSDYSSSYSALEQPEDLSTLSNISLSLKDKLVIQLSSSRTVESVRWKSFLDSVGAINIDGCVIGWPVMVGTPKFNILISGCEDEVFQQTQDLLQTWGTPTFVGKEPGMADAFDFGVLTFLQGIKFGYMQGLAICKQANVSPDLYLQFSKRYLSIYESVIEDINRKVEAQSYETNINTTVNVLHDFFLKVAQHSEEEGLSTEFMDAINTPLAALRDSEKGQIDQTAVYEYMRDRNSAFFKK